MKRKGIQETVLYYNPQQNANTIKLKGVLVRMGIRIKNVTPEQMHETIGGLLGMPASGAGEQETQAELPAITQEMLVMHQFRGSRLDELLLNLRKAGVPKIALKAVVTESNVNWTFYQLYEEIKEEHEKMQAADR